MDLQSKVREMSRYLEDEAIAQALKLTPEAVRDILEGKAEIRREDSPAQGPVIHVSSVKTAYRQRVVSVLRAKGGVGATVVAIGLALSLSREVKTLLADFTFSEGGSDLSYYLNLPDYPHMGVFAGVLDDCVVGLEPDLFVLQPPRNARGERDKVEAVIARAREDYDAVVMDLPNGDGDVVQRALGLSNAVVAVTGGLGSELVRLAAALAGLRQKDVVLVLNRCSLPAEAREAFRGIRTVRLEHDGSLAGTLERCGLPGEKSAFMRGMAEVRDALFDRQKKSLLKSLLGGF
ncbi:hypothetical protein H5T53_00530 [Candidatus Bipolaricaulota bacterium]|nr:hypothetical protein [Candidatus Bipolaricaulota bacterium]